MVFFSLAATPPCTAAGPRILQHLFSHTLLASLCNLRSLQDLPQLHDLHAALGGSPLLHHHNITLQGGGSSSLPARLADRLSG